MNAMNVMGTSCTAWWLGAEASLEGNGVNNQGLPVNEYPNKSAISQTMQCSPNLYHIHAFSFSI